MAGGGIENNTGGRICAFIIIFLLFLMNFYPLICIILDSIRYYKIHNIFSQINIIINIIILLLYYIYFYIHKKNNLNPKDGICRIIRYELFIMCIGIIYSIIIDLYNFSFPLYTILKNIFFMHLLLMYMPMPTKTLKKQKRKSI